MNKNNFWKLVASVVISHAAGIIGSVFTVTSIDNWYTFLNKPSFFPPDWVFSLVWLTLYTLMGISFYLIWTSYVPSSWKKKAMVFFIAHILVNASWSIVFFGFHNIAFAFAVILLLLFMLVNLIRIFYRINPRASYLLWPYLFWVLFAILLNYYLMILN